jgi:SET domain-containing protein
MTHKAPDFCAFESALVGLKTPEKDIQHYQEAQGLLRRTASVKVWDKIGLGRSSASNWGVFSVDHIEKGEVFEVAPLLFLPKDAAKGTDLIDYVFKIEDNQYALALGYASLYNHRNQPMASWKLDVEKGTITFAALRNILPGEEIFVSYGKNYWKSRGETPTADAKLTTK